MNWKERAAIFLTENSPRPIPPKPPKAPLDGLGGTGGAPFPFVKKQSTPSKPRHAYQYILKDGGGGGMYITPDDLGLARQELLRRYGDRLVVVTKTGEFE